MSDDPEKEERKRDLIESLAAIGLTIIILLAIIGGLALFA